MDRMNRSDRQPAPPATPTGAPGLSARPWLGVQFVCANQYRRVYRGAASDQYLARCPSCGRCVRFKVGQGGMNHRFYEIDCR